MHIGPSEARDLTFYEYTATLANWEAMHESGGNALPDLTNDQMDAMTARMAAKGYKVLN